MQPTTALGLILCAAALLLTADRRQSPERSLVAAALAAVASLLGWLTLAEIFIGWDTGVARFRFDLIAASAYLYPARSSPQTAVTLAVVGAGIVTHNLRHVSVRVGHLCALAVAANAVVAMTGYIFDTAQFYGFPVATPAVGMAIPTTVAFVLLALALLFSRPAVGMMSLISSDTPSGGIARRLLLVGILAPPLVGGATRLGVFAGWYGVNVQSSLFVLVMVALVLRTTWLAARQAERDELRTLTALADFRAANEELQRALDDRRVFEALIENSPDFIGIADPAGKPVYLNPAGRQMVGLAPDFPIERTRIPDYYPPAQRAFASHVILKSMADKGQWKGDTYFRHWQTEDAIPVYDEHFIIRDGERGRLLGMGTITRDISDLRRTQDRLRLSEAKFSGIVSVSPDAIVSIDEKHRITLFNEGARAHLRILQGRGDRRADRHADPGAVSCDTSGAPRDVRQERRISPAHGRSDTDPGTAQKWRGVSRRRRHLQAPSRRHADHDGHRSRCHGPEACRAGAELPCRRRDGAVVDARLRRDAEEHRASCRARSGRLLHCRGQPARRRVQAREGRQAGTPKRHGLAICSPSHRPAGGAARC